MRRLKAPYEARSTQRAEERAAEQARRRRLVEKSERDYFAQKNIRDKNEKRGCERALGLAKDSVTGFDATVDGSGHFTGVTVYHHGGSRWMYTGRGVRDLHAWWERLGALFPKRNVPTKQKGKVQ